MKKPGDENDQNSKPSANNEPQNPQQQQTTNAVAYAFVHPARPITAIYYFPAITTYLISELALSFVPNPGNENNLRVEQANYDEEYEYRHYSMHNNNNNYQYFSLAPSFVITSFFLFMLASNIVYGPAPDTENRYVSRSDDAAVITNRVGGTLLAGLSSLVSYGRNLFGGLGGIGTGFISHGTSEALGIFESLTNDRILDNHSRDRSSVDNNGQVTGYMRAIDYFGDRSERAITRSVAVVSWLLYRYLNSEFAARIHLNDNNRAAYRAAVLNGERFTIDLLVSYMNSIVYYARSTADLYLVSAILQTLRIADSSGSNIGLYRAIEVDDSSNLGEVIENIGDRIEDVGESVADGMRNIANGASRFFNNLGDRIGDALDLGESDQTTAPAVITRVDAHTQTDAEFQGLIPWLRNFIFGYPSVNQAAGFSNNVRIHPPGHHHTIDYFRHLFDHHQMPINFIDGSNQRYTLQNGASISIAESENSPLEGDLTIINRDGRISAVLPRNVQVTSSQIQPSIPGLQSVSLNEDLWVQTVDYDIRISRLNPADQLQYSNFCGLFGSHGKHAGHFSGAHSKTEIKSYQPEKGGPISYCIENLQITIFPKSAVGARTRKYLNEEADNFKVNSHRDHDDDYSDLSGSTAGADCLW